MIPGRDECIYFVLCFTRYDAQLLGKELSELKHSSFVYSLKYLGLSEIVYGSLTPPQTNLHKFPIDAVYDYKSLLLVGPSGII